MIRFLLTQSPVKLGPIEAPAAGATVTFDGKVRNHNDGKPVLRLEYEAFSAMAESEGQAICEEAAKHFGLSVSLATHRTGLLEIGETALLVVTSAPHREAALLGCEWIVEEIKRRLPVWKKEHYESGATEWLGCQPQDILDERQYSTQIALPQVGREGQAKLKESSVLVVGAGGLGAAAVPLLSGAGIGTIGIADQDVVDESNLPRQTVYTRGQVGLSKALLAARHAQKQNPQATVRTHPFVTPENAKEIVGAYDVVIDGSDNFATKFLVNDTCVELGAPLVQASLHGFAGQVMVVKPNQDSGCLRCVWADMPGEDSADNCSDGATFGPSATVLGAMQAGEAIKLLLGISSAAQQNLVLVDLLTLGTTHIVRKKDPLCRACGSGQAETDIYIGADQAVGSCDLLIDISMDGKAGPGMVSVSWSLGIEEIENAAKSARRVALVCEQGVRSASVARHLRTKGLQCFAVVGGRRGFTTDA